MSGLSPNTWNKPTPDCFLFSRRSRRIDMRTLKLFFYGLLVLLFAIFILQNYSTLTYSVALRLNLGFLYLMSKPLPLFLAVPLFFFLGLFLGTIFGWGKRRSLSKEIKQLKSPKPEPRPEIRPELKPEPKLEPRPEAKQEVNPGLKSEPRPESRPEPKPETEPKKKPDEGTIVSLGPLVKKAGSPADNNPPQRS
jgi:hypothetical protein